MILRWESEKSIFSAGFRQISYKKKVIFFVLRAKVKKNKKLRKSVFFINSPWGLGGGLLWDTLQENMTHTHIFWQYLFWYVFFETESITVTTEEEIIESEDAIVKALNLKLVEENLALVIIRIYMLGNRSILRHHFKGW